jgi:hypothetical protein
LQLRASPVITDTDRYKHSGRVTVAAVTSAVGFLVSIAFATDIGAPRRKFLHLAARL